MNILVNFMLKFILFSSQFQRNYFWSEENAWMCQLINDRDKRPEGFPPGMWFLITGKPTAYPTQDEIDKFPMMFKSAHQENDLKKQYRSDGTCVVTGLSDDFHVRMKRD